MDDLFVVDKGDQCLQEVEGGDSSAASFIGRAGASPPSRAATARTIYIYI